MAGFLYFLEGAREGQVRDLLPMRGLGHVALDGLRKRGATTGPGGVDGIVVARADSVPTSQIGYFADRQTWRRVPGQEGAWVGLIEGELPGPADLARSEIVAGEDVRLGDGNLWHVPVATAWDGPPLVACTRLPCVMDVDDAGGWCYGDVVSQYRRLWELAKEWTRAKARVTDWLDAHDTPEGLDEPRLTNDWVYSRSTETLAANYRIGPVEAALLGLFVSGQKWVVLNTLIDNQGLMAILAGAAADTLEKKTAASPATTPGSTVD